MIENMTRKVSVVVPVYYNALSLPELFNRLDNLNRELLGINLELEVVAVDDGSKDDSFAILVEYSKQGVPTSIDQINRALGVKNKEVTIQNKLRSDTLQMINKKFMVFASTSDTLVEREKTALDKRVYQYKINERYLNKIK